MPTNGGGHLVTDEDNSSEPLLEYFVRAQQRQEEIRKRNEANAWWLWAKAFEWQNGLGDRQEPKDVTS